MASELLDLLDQSDNTKLTNTMVNSEEKFKSKIKISIIGDGGVGKTTYINRLLTGEFTRPYISTRGVNERVVDFGSNYGVVSFLVTELSGQEKFALNYKERYANSDGVIVMFDVTSNLSFTSCNKFIEDFYSVNAISVPIVICGNKIDAKERKVSTQKFLKLEPKNNVQHYEKYEISAKYCCNWDKPFLYLARKITNHDDLYFCDEISISAEKTEETEKTEKLEKTEKSKINNKYQQHVDKINAMFATGVFTIPILKKQCLKTTLLMDEILIDYQVTCLGKLYNELIGAIKLLQGQQYLSVMKDLLVMEDPEDFED